MKCLNEKNPEVVVDIYANNDMASNDSRIKNVMRNYYSQRAFNCENDSISFDSDGKVNPTSLKYRICKQDVTALRTKG